MPEKNSPQVSSFYPTIKIDRIKNPNRFYAFPIIGGFVKIIMIIPVAIYLAILSIADFFIIIINTFIVLFTGKYWKVAYDFNLGLIRLSTKISFFFSGLTNKYPGFSFAIEDNYRLDIKMPTKPNRLFAIPLFGFVARIILLIPYFIYSYVIQSSANIATVASSFIVLFKGYYPETTYELNRDTVRLSQAASAYIFGLYDIYPNFWISMNHKKMKILLIILGILSIIFNYSNRKNNSDYKKSYYNSTSSQNQKTY
jgi:hypothetical protein